MFGLCLIPNRVQIAAHKEEVNCVPLSEVRRAETPKQAFHPWNRGEAHSEAEMLSRVLLLAI